MQAALVDGILQASNVSEPFQLIIDILTQYDWESLGSREVQRQRQRVIRANPCLLERDLIKHHRTAIGFTDALRKRGVEADVARLSASVAIEVFFAAYGQWLEGGKQADLPTISKQMMSQLATIIPSGATKVRRKFG